MPTAELVHHKAIPVVNLLKMHTSDDHSKSGQTEHP